MCICSLILCLDFRLMMKVSSAYCSERGMHFSSDKFPEMIVSEDVLFGSAFSGGLDDIHVMGMSGIYL